ncbi:CLUMA_CG003562, isoform A [Clunio marinus]|uniref:CLUMA_CG003562, isoform A n=1 Tax=Clunio marinus TaxID=568069 RepID=A0A1J1HP49_9DIPT|nr:CLUMA_CG003562, isoform A [Clunio marinus]
MFKTQLNVGIMAPNKFLDYEASSTQLGSLPLLAEKNELDWRGEEEEEIESSGVKQSRNVHQNVITCKVLPRKVFEEQINHKSRKKKMEHSAEMQFAFCKKTHNST